MNPSPAPGLADSLLLWPDPFDDPAVPPEPLLLGCLAAAQLDPDLDQQLAASISAQRASQLLYLTQEALHPEEDAQRPGAPPLPEPRPRSPDGPVSVAQAYTTRRAVEIFARAEDLGQRRWTFQPVPVLLVSGPHQPHPLDTLYRAVPLTAADLWPEQWRSPWDVPITTEKAGSYVAHLDLEYPVSVTQLHLPFDTVPVADMERLAERGAGWPEGDALPADPQLDEEATLERARLLARCSWLPMTADARREQWEMYLDGVSALKAAATAVPQTQRLVITGAALEDELALAARGVGVATSHAILVNEPPGGAVGMSLGRQMAFAGPGTRVTAETSPSHERFTQAIFAEWDVSNLLPSPHQPRFFCVLNAAKELVATGLVRDSRAQAFGCEREVAEASLNEWQDWCLVIFQQNPHRREDA
jgi:hypothetical protein